MPNLFVVGAMKCGTSSMHHYLGLHPEIQMSRHKELNYFVGDLESDWAEFADSAWEVARLARTNGERDQGWYAEHFDSAAGWRGDTSVAYGYPWFGGCAERIAAAAGLAEGADVRVIYLVRDPVERMVSQYLHMREHEPLGMTETLARPANPHLAISRYRSCIQPFLDQFGRDRVHLVNQGDLLARRRETMAGVFGFLGVDSEFWVSGMEVERNRFVASSGRHGAVQRIASRMPALMKRRVSPRLRGWGERALAGGAPAGSEVASRLPSIDPDLQRELVARLEPEISGIEELTGWDLASWRASPG